VNVGKPSSTTSATMLAAYVSRATLVPVPLKSRATIFLRARWSSTHAEVPLQNKSKVWESPDEAVKDVKSGDVLLCGGEFHNFFYFYTGCIMFRP
jgi:hypothetical protein